MKPEQASRARWALDVCMRLLTALPWAVLACGVVARLAPIVSPRRWLSHLAVAVLLPALLLVLSRFTRWSGRGSWLGLALGSLTALPVGLWLWIDPFGARILYDPGDCVVPLRRTDLCQGEDASFIECRYRFRAEGEPRSSRCEAFLGARSVATPPSGRRCDYDEPGVWERVPCVRYGLPEAMQCFACEGGDHESRRRYVDAFASGCEREIVLAACNQSLE